MNGFLLWLLLLSTLLWLLFSDYSDLWLSLRLRWSLNNNIATFSIPLIFLFLFLFFGDGIFKFAVALTLIGLYLI